MPIAQGYKNAVQNIINKLNAEVTSTKPRRHLSTLFLELPDPSAYADYYSIITEPRSINGVQEKLQKNRYRNILDVLNDLYLVFANAIHYNEATSQISKDAAVLKEMFEKLWKDDPYLPNAQPTKQPGRKPGFRAIPLPRMSSFAIPQRSDSSSFQPSYSTALATVQLKPVGKPPAPIVAPRIQPLKPRRHRRKRPTSTEQAQQDVAKAGARVRRPHSPSFSEVDFQSNVDAEEVEPDIPQTHIANEAESAMITKRLDDSLPRWEPWGTGDTPIASQTGWMPDLEGDALQARLEDFVSRMRKFHDAAEQTPLIALEDVATRPDPYSTFDGFIAWASITTRISQRQYLSSRQFETDIFRLFEKARRFYSPATQNYGWVLVCQRLANILTSSAVAFPMDAQITMSSSPGPRRAQQYQKSVDGSIVENPGGTLSYDILPKGREHAESVRFKGIEYKVGDFVHLTNPDDMSRPMVGQIWACWNANNTQSFTVCWYLRPEQTSHRSNHPFYENEVVKTGLYVDYLPQDIIEKVCVQFHPHYFTGRPRPPHWYPSWPIYMCEQRYDERNRSFHHINSPELCFPFSLRHASTTAASQYQHISNSIMHAPLVQNRKLDAIQPIYPFERLVFPLRKSGPNAGPRLPTSTGPTSFTIGPADNKEGNVGGMNGGGFDMGRRPKRMAAVKAASAVGSPVPGSPGGPMMGPGGNMGIPATIPLPGDRTIVSAAGGGMITAASVDKLPSETTQMFDRDSISNEMLWFSGAPLDVARTPTPRYSLDYLYQLALNQKRKAGDLMEDDLPSSKKVKRVVLPTASEVWYDASIAAASNGGTPH